MFRIDISWFVVESGWVCRETVYNFPYTENYKGMVEDYAKEYLSNMSDFPYNADVVKFMLINNKNNVIYDDYMIDYEDFLIDYLDQ